MEPTAYSRRFLRIKPDSPLWGEIRIIQIGGKHVLSNMARVRVLDIGCGGVRFASALKLPAGSNVMLELSMRSEGAEYRFGGYIVSSLNTGVCGYEYGLCFIKPDIKLRQLLLKIFGRNSARQDRYIIIRMSRGQPN